MCNILWLEGSVVVDFTELTMFYPSIIEADLIIVFDSYDVIIYEFKKKLKEIFEDLFKYLGFPPGITSIELHSPAKAKKEEYENIGLPARIIKHSRSFLKIIKSLSKDINSFDKTITSIALLENLFFSINNWLNVVLLYYSPKSLKILNDFLIEIPFLGLKTSSRDNGDIVYLSKEIAKYKYDVILGIKGLRKQAINEHFKSLINSIINNDFNKYKYHECLTIEEIKTYNCGKIIVLVPTLKGVVGEVREVLQETILNINNVEVIFIGTSKSCKYISMLLELSDNNTSICNVKDNECSETLNINDVNVRYCQVSYTNPNYNVLDKLIDSLNNVCFIVLSEFPKYMLVKFTEYLYNLYGDTIMHRIFVLSPKKPIPIDYVNARARLVYADRDSIIDIRNRYDGGSQRFYCLQSLDDVV